MEIHVNATQVGYGRDYPGIIKLIKSGEHKKKFSVMERVASAWDEESGQAVSIAKSSCSTSKEYILNFRILNQILSTQSSRRLHLLKFH